MGEYDAANVILATGGMISNAYANRREMEIAAYNAQLQRDNLGFAKEKFKYDQALQQTLFNREDNSIQRRVADLKAAGINPVLAAGQGAGAGAAVQTTAPKSEMRDSSHVDRIAMRNMAQNEMVLNMLQMRKNIEQTDADIARTKMQTERERHDMQSEERYYALDLRKFDFEARQAGIHVDQETARILLSQDRNELERQSLRLQENRDRIEADLKRAQTDVAVREKVIKELEAVGVEYSNIRKLIDNRITLYDFMWSVDMAMRNKDPTDWRERTADRLTSALMPGYMDSLDVKNRKPVVGKAVDVEMKKLRDQVTGESTSRWLDKYRR